MSTKRILFVSNGHGEIAIAQRIAREMPEDIGCDHLALVGTHAGAPDALAPMREVGPRRVLPSGGLIAMGNVRNIARDIRAGLIGHTLSQLRFLQGAGRTYCAAIAVGDVFALLMALRARAKETVFVGTAKSVYVAPYGSFEERVIGKAQVVFVRDAPTAEQLCAHGIRAHPANVIVDLYAHEGLAPIDVPFEPRLAVFPGSREAAYGDAVALGRIVRELSHEHSRLGAVLSIAPGLDASRMAAAFARDGWYVRHLADPTPFSLFDKDREIVRAWRGPIAATLPGTQLVLGQAGTANEGAAASGIPVVAFEPSGAHAWYRKRQMGLLGDALLVTGGNESQAAAVITALLHDQARRERMVRAGRERMGSPGAAKAIAQEVVRLCS